MSEKRERTQYTGIYQRHSDSRRNPRDGKIDACFYYVVKNNAQKQWIKVGWKSKGYTVQDARKMRGDHMQALRHGEKFAKIKEEESRGDQRNTLTFGDAWEIYAAKWFPNLSRSQDEIARYNNHIAPRFADTYLADIKLVDLEDLKSDLLFNKNLSPGTVKHVLGNIRRVFNKGDL